MDVPVGLTGLDEAYGSFTYHELSGGNVQLDGSWEADNLVTLRNVCGTGLNIRLHHLVVPLFQEGLTAAMKVAPDYAVRMLGGFCPRHQLHDATKPLSVHSWGAAFDVNWDKNPVGHVLVTDLPSAFVSAFTSRGWDWGGSWKHSKDAMHFQYARGV